MNQKTCCIYRFRRWRVALGLVLVGLVSLCSGLGWAVEIPDLYIIDVPVESQSDSQRNRAILAGLERVLVRVTGSQASLNDSQLRQRLPRAQDYLTQFNYVEEEIEDNGIEAKVRQYLRLQFDETLVNKLLREVRLPIWGSNRPSLLLWLVLESDGQRRLLSAEHTNELTELIAEAAQLRGLPIVYPLLDLEDQMNLSPLEAWGMFQDRIENASLRYGVDAIAAARAYREGTDRWRGSWLFIFGGQVYRFSMDGVDLASQVERVVNEIADRLGGHYAVRTSFTQRTQLLLSVEGIQSVALYDQVLSYLTKLAAVRDVHILKIVEDKIVFDIDTDATADKFREELSLDHKLTPSGNGSSLALQDNILHYRWQP